MIDNTFVKISPKDDFAYYLIYSLCKKASNHHANLPLEMYSFTL